MNQHAQQSLFRLLLMIQQIYVLLLAQLNLIILPQIKHMNVFQYAHLHLLCLLIILLELVYKTVQVEILILMPIAQ